MLEVEGVDPTHTISNHLIEMFDVFGVEAARAAIILEIRNVLEYVGMGKAGWRGIGDWLVL